MSDPGSQGPAPPPPAPATSNLPEPLSPEKRLTLAVDFPFITKIVDKWSFPQFTRFQAVGLSLIVIAMLTMGTLAVKGIAPSGIMTELLVFLPIIGCLGVLFLLRNLWDGKDK